MWGEGVLKLTELVPLLASPPPHVMNIWSWRASFDGLCIPLSILGCSSRVFICFIKFILSFTVHTELSSCYSIHFYRFQLDKTC